MNSLTRRSGHSSDASSGRESIYALSSCAEDFLSSGANFEREELILDDEWMLSSLWRAVDFVEHSLPSSKQQKYVVSLCHEMKTIIAEAIRATPSVGYTKEVKAELGVPLLPSHSQQLQTGGASDGAFPLESDLHYSVSPPSPEASPVPGTPEESVKGEKEKEKLGRKIGATIKNLFRTAQQARPIVASLSLPFEGQLLGEPALVEESLWSLNLFPYIVLTELCEENKRYSFPVPSIRGHEGAILKVGSRFCSR